MTDQQLYDESVEMAVAIVKTRTRDEVKKWAWLPLTLLYEQMIRRKEIEPMSSLPEVQKRKYWDQTEGINYKTTEIFKRKVVCQALYMFDLLSGEQSIQECDATKA